jgi:hypothetical protein
MLTVDPLLITKAREQDMNLSKMFSEALTKQLGEVEDANDPEVKSKRLDERIAANELQIEQAKKDCEQAKKEKEQLVIYQKEYAEKARQKAKDAADKYKTALDLEINNNWAIYVRGNHLTTQTKRNKLYQTRAAQMGMTLEQYKNEVVAVCEGRGIK